MRGDFDGIPLSCQPGDRKNVLRFDGIRSSSVLVLSMPGRIDAWSRCGWVTCVHVPRHTESAWSGFGRYGVCLLGPFPWKFFGCRSEENAQGGHAKDPGRERQEHKSDIVAVDGDYDCTAAAHDQAGPNRAFPTKTNAVPGDHAAANGENPEQYSTSQYDQETEAASSHQQHDWPANVGNSGVRFDVYEEGVPAFRFCPSDA